MTRGGHKKTIEFPVLSLFFVSVRGPVRRGDDLGQLGGDPAARPSGVAVHTGPAHPAQVQGRLLPAQGVPGNLGDATGKARRGRTGDPELDLAGWKL